MEKAIEIVVGVVAGALLFGTLGLLVCLALSFAKLDIIPLFWATVRFFIAVGAITGLIMELKD